MNSLYENVNWKSKYDYGVRRNVSIPEKSVIDLLNENYELCANRTVLIFEDKTYSFAEIHALSNSVASFLIDKGITPGQCVGINLDNCPHLLICLLGAIKAGCIVTGLSPLLGTARLSEQLRNSSISVLFTTEKYYQDKAEAYDDKPLLRYIVFADEETDRTSGIGEIIPDVYSLKAITEGYPSVPVHVQRTAKDLLLRQFTSGTTGHPKGINITNKNVLASILGELEWFKVPTFPMTMVSQIPDVVSFGLPCTHMGGLFFLLLNLIAGNISILQRNPRDMEQYCSNLRKYRPTVIHNVPSFYRLLSNTPDIDTIDFSNLKYCTSGASVLPDRLMYKLESVMGKGKIVEGLGMTETCALYCANPFKGKKKTGCVGLPMPNISIRIVDEHKNDVPFGTPGEIIVSGPQVAASMIDGQSLLTESGGKCWLFTGDIAKCTADGYLQIVGRKKNIINVSGYKVAPKSVETVLLQLPIIASCAVIGVPNPEKPGSELVKAVIQLNKAFEVPEGLKEILVRYCSTKLSPYEIPKIISIVDSFPMTPSGKIDLEKLKEKN